MHKALLLYSKAGVFQSQPQAKGQVATTQPETWCCWWQGAQDQELSLIQGPALISTCTHARTENHISTHIAFKHSHELVRTPTS